MKLLIFVCSTLLVGAFGYNWEPEDLECLKDLNIEKSVIDAFPDPMETPTPVDNKVYNDFTECVWKKQKLLDADGKIIWGRFNTLLEEELTKGAENDTLSSDEQFAAVFVGGIFQLLLDDCHKIKSNSPGELAVKTQNCIGEKLRKLSEESSEEE